MAITVLSDRLIEVEDADLRSRLEQGVRSVRRSGRIFRWVVSLFFAGLGLLMLFFQFRLRLLPPMSALAVSGTPLLLAAGVLWGDFGYNHGRLAKMLLRLMLCPSCGEDLRGIAVEHDMLQCRCGATWKVTPARSIT